MRQAVWFHRCPDNIPIAKQRYIEQTVRVFEVLETTSRIRNTYTYADLSSIPWNKVALFAPFFKDILWDKYRIEEKTPNFLSWHQRLSSPPAVQKAYGESQG
ncbi:hypothetical protein EDB81DRAFT_952875 [Dactylonectria macrodidyma]|uniref:GST C-terminal domain-containing protein n=1 Tax=Dactylonectria macrodidyma TaxID=307937 RepID=A0A9P9DBL4_9HYPO|nr:hypothetical protein EDB81DRAFT_952875 [Dactylonectria macrodidyma]